MNDGVCYCDECREDAALYALHSLTAAEQDNFELRIEAGCPRCTADAADFAVVTEHLALSVEAVQPPPGLRGRLLDRAVGKNPKAAPEAVSVVRGDSPWLPTPITGVETRMLLNKRTMLLRLQPGASYPEHFHRQNEQCFVVEGTVIDSAGLTLKKGDFINMPSGSRHHSIHSDTGCVLLIAYTN